jgi:membrane protease YdiL (CAAX protease family)
MTSPLPANATPVDSAPLTFRRELADFWHCVRHPSLSPRIGRGRRGAGIVADFTPRISIGRLLSWAAILWTLNIFLLGPLAGAAAGASGSQHRLDIHHIPWLMAVSWAPLVEELVFRYGLRRPLQALWMVPLMAVAMVWGPHLWTGAIVAVALGLAWWSASRLRPHRYRWRRAYSRHFGWVFHLSVLAFAGLHLKNFTLSGSSDWLLPLMVLPQWVTGLVLTWMRIRRGIGASVALHAVFNAGPLLLVALLLQLAPGLT